MGILKQHVELKAYNQTIKGLRNEIKELKNILSKKPSDDSNAAKHALSKCTEYKHRCEESQKSINIISNDISLKQSNINEQLKIITEYKENILKINNLSLEAENEINTLKNKVTTIDSIFENKDNLHSNIEELTTFYENGNDLSNKIDAIYNGIKVKKNDIESLSYEIFGYDEENEEKEIKHVDGLKDRLEVSYNSITSDLEKLKQVLLDINSETDIKYKEFIADKELKFHALSHEIEELLPKALTAGLSHAFAEKRETEIIEGKELAKKFSKAITGLVFISFIPFMVSIYLLISGATLSTVINDIPRMVLSILPLYIPIVWLAYSSSKKINLSKRLVEEYTHKEVLSKTFEGLSKQIENIDDREVSSELKIKLLHNILSVSSENPGKLISDYNKADHPLMDALDKSAKLNDAIDSISKIPGLSKLSKVLENRADKFKEEQENKISSGLEDAEQSNIQPNKTLEEEQVKTADKSS